MRLIGPYSLRLVVDVGVLSNIIALTRRGFITVFIDDGRSQVLKSNSFLNNLRNLIQDGDLNLLLTERLRRNKGLFTTTDYWVLAGGLILDLRTQLSAKSVFLTRNQVSVGHSIGNNSASLNISTFSLGGLGADRWSPLSGVHGLVIIIDVLVSGDLYFFTRVREVLAVGINFCREQLLKSNSRSNNTLEIVINLDVNNNITSRSLRRESLRPLTNNSMLTVLISSLVTQLRLQGVFLTRNQVSELHSVLDNGTSRNLRSLTKISLRLNRRVPLSGIHSLVTIVDVLVSGDQVTVALLIRSILTVFIHLFREQLLKSNSRTNGTLRLVVDGDCNVFRTNRLLSSELMGSLTQNGLTVILGDQLCLQGVVLTWN